jgi:predicted nucleic acid-binding protein
VPCRSSAYLPETNGTEALAEVVFDTDILVDHLQGTRVIDVGYEGSAYSSVTRAELYSARGANERVIDRLLGQFDEIPVDQTIAEEAGRTRRTWAEAA